MPIELVFVIGMVVLFTLALKVKANAFISLLATALVMGLLSGMSGPATIKAITGGFSGTVKSIGIVIILASWWEISSMLQKEPTGWLSTQFVWWGRNMHPLPWLSRATLYLFLFSPMPRLLSFLRS